MYWYLCSILSLCRYYDLYASFKVKYTETVCMCVCVYLSARDPSTTHGIGSHSDMADSLDARIEGDDGEQRRDEQDGAGGDGVGRPKERRPRHHHEERGRNVHAQEVVPVAPLEGHGGAQAGVVACG